MKQGIIIRTVILIWLLFLGVFGVHAQNYFTLPDSNATWITTDASSAGQGFFMHGLSEFQDDTIIDSKVYHKIFLWDILDSYSYAGAFRSDTSGKTYYRTPYTVADTTEYLLFDLSANIGDTIRDIAMHMPLHDFVGAYDFIVDTIRYIEHDSHSLKCIYLYPLEPKPPYYFNLNPIVWLEMVGSLNGGIFNYYLCGLNIEWLRCMNVDDTIRYFNLYGDCYFMDSLGLIFEEGVCELPVNIPEQQPTSQLSAYPNPFTTTTTIGFTLNGKSKIQISIYNTFGQSVYQFEDSFEPGSHTVTWPPNHLPSGMYYGVLRSEEGVSVVKMIKE